jgi:hypothetical protein
MNGTPEKEGPSSRRPQNASNHPRGPSPRAIYQVSVISGEDHEKFDFFGGGGTRKGCIAAGSIGSRP